MTRPMPEPDIAVMIEDDRWDAVGLAALSAAPIKAALSHLSLNAEPYEIVVMGCDDARIAALNAEFRDKPRPTNVLSWPAQDLGPLIPGEPPAKPEPDPFDDATPLGDIALAFETCKAEAEAQQKSFANHVTHLVLHGTLHLLGYDHENDADAARMEALEVEVLARLGIESPY